MNFNIYNNIVSRKKDKRKSFAVLIDPDKPNQKELQNLVSVSVEAGVDFFFLGGSLLMRDCMDECIETIKKESDIPVILFPGSSMQINNKADAIFFLSLISGRNPDLLIGQQVLSAPLLKNSGLEVIPTGYILIDGGKPTTVSYMSNTCPIPADKADVAACTAMAGEMLGLKIIYMDAGSGAKEPIREEMVKKVAECVDIAIITGGGIRTPEKALSITKAGADIVVVGNAIEKEVTLAKEIADAIKSIDYSVVTK